MDQAGGFLKAISMPLVSISDKLAEPPKNKLTGQKGGADNVSGGLMTIDKIISLVATIAFMALAGYLCWECNINESRVLRVIYTVLAVAFNWIYLLYYFIIHIVMGNPCSK